MHHPYQHTHTMAGQHHHHVLAMHHHHTRHREQGDSKEDSMRTLHTQQLDYLYTQLDSLKKNMREKQNCLGKVHRFLSDLKHEDFYMINLIFSDYRRAENDD